ncbi:hypothetical protein DFP89_101382 [Paracoccus lutimaris]|uniref:Secreted protein n=1 Tax=Paracoccus lutimaris TaxID=1490030 RepID=A0A368Z950_9RHOB|nr:hypothetical protein DFP89_101382 [Paracoccus lutimaris]
MTAMQITMNEASRIPLASVLRRVVLAVWVAALAAGGAAVAQEAPGGGPGGPDGPGGPGAPEGNFGTTVGGGGAVVDGRAPPQAGRPGPVVETVDDILSEFLLRSQKGAGALSGVLPGVAPSPSIAEAAVSVEDDGTVGLIEAPEGAPGVAGDAVAAETYPPEDPAGAGVAAFAEAQPQGRQMMPGPVGHPPVVVELFTSQGCSSCPPADDMLGDLAAREDVLALSWHVDYWDYLGWADEFARPEFTRRQQAYAHASGERAIYTPQIIVGGTDTLIALRPAELMALLQAQIARPTEVMVTSSRQDDSYRVELTPRAAIPSRVAIILVRYVPSRKVEILAGENRGTSVEYRNVVLAVERIAEWDGRVPLRMTIRPGATVEKGASSFPSDTRHAILAQEMDSRGKRASGPILAAIRLD